MLFQVFVHLSKPSVDSNWSYSAETLNLGQNWWFFCPVWPSNLTDDLEKQKGTTSLLLQAICIIHSHRRTHSPETLIWGQNWRFFLSKCDLEIWWMILKKKTVGYLFYATSSFVHNCVAICEIKLELRSGNAQIGTKFVLAFVTLTFDLWPWDFARTLLVSMVIILEKNYSRFKIQKHLFDNVQI